MMDERAGALQILRADECNAIAGAREEKMLIAVDCAWAGKQEPNESSFPEFWGNKQVKEDNVATLCCVSTRRYPTAARLSAPTSLL